MKKALLIVSFGTSYTDIIEKNIVPIEQKISSYFPDRLLIRAFTSGMILKKLKNRDNLHIHNVTEALDFLLENNYTDVLIQTTHILCGDEYEKLQSLTRPFITKFDNISIGNPLLTEVTDYEFITELIKKELPKQQNGYAHIYMGHGTNHQSNSTYALLEYMLHDQGRKDIFVGTVEGYPTLNEVQNRLLELGDVTNITLRPLMIVAGDHAKNDMASDEEDSWKSILQSENYTVECILKGLGEYPEVAELFAIHAQNSKEITI